MNKNINIFIIISFAFHFILLLFFSVFLDHDDLKIEKTTIYVSLKNEMKSKENKKINEVENSSTTLKELHAIDNLSDFISNKYKSTILNSKQKDFQNKTELMNYSKFDYDFEISNTIDSSLEKQIYKNKLEEYINSVTNKIEKNWDIPLNFNKNTNCKVFIFQDNFGNLSSYSIDPKCPPNPDLINSIKNSIELSFPILKPPSYLKFEDIKKIEFEFKIIL